MINYDYLFDDKEEKFKEILDEARSGRVQLVDIRERDEWEQSHFKCAVHLPLSELKQGRGVDVLKKIRQENKKIYLHCRSGNRARQAEEILAKYGCKEFSVIPLSMLRMIDKGFQLTG
jgi:rhodanese-related sulfurtransferase